MLIFCLLFIFIFVDLTMQDRTSKKERQREHHPDEAPVQHWLYATQTRLQRIFHHNRKNSESIVLFEGACFEKDSLTLARRTRKNRHFVHFHCHLTTFSVVRKIVFHPKRFKWYNQWYFCHIKRLNKCRWIFEVKDLNSNNNTDKKKGPHKIKIQLQQNMHSHLATRA